MAGEVAAADPVVEGDSEHSSTWAAERIEPGVDWCTLQRARQGFPQVAPHGVLHRALHCRWAGENLVEEEAVGESSAAVDGLVEKAAGYFLQQVSGWTEWQADERTAQVALLLLRPLLRLAPLQWELPPQQAFLQGILREAVLPQTLHYAHWLAGGEVADEHLDHDEIAVERALAEVNPEHSS